VRLAAKLTGWDIDIISTEEYEKEKAAEAEREMEAAIDKEQAKMTPLTMLSGVGGKTATLLEEAGYKTVEDVVSLSIESLKAIPGVGEKTAQKIIKGAREKLGLKDGEA
jgi:N utilization substance protein A